MNDGPRMFLNGAHQAQLQAKERLASRVESICAPPLDPGPGSLLASALRSGESLTSYLGDRGVTLTSFILFNAQRRNALTAAVNAVPVAEEPIEEVLLEEVTQWLAGDDHSQDSFEKVLSRVLRPTLEQATLSHGDQLGKILAVSERDRQEAIATAIKTTSDLRARLVQAEDDRGSLSAAAWKLSTLLSKKNYVRVVQSVVDHSKQVLEHLSYKRGAFKDASYTGVRRWVAGDPSPGSRHASLHHVEDATGEGWELPERRIGNKVLPPRTVLFPMDSPDDPAEFSGSTSFVEYQRIVRGKVRWVRA